MLGAGGSSGCSGAGVLLKYSIIYIAPFSNILFYKAASCVVFDVMYTRA